VAQDKQSVWAWLGGRERFVVGEIERAVLAAITREEAGQGEEAGQSEQAGQSRKQGQGVLFAIGEPAGGLAGWRLTHRQAQAALTVALRRNGISRNGTPAQGVTFTRYADVALLAGVLKDEALAKALIEIYLSPLEDSRGSGPVLRQTLRAYLDAERSVSSAAIALGVVRKTVESRLHTIEERLGRTLHPCPAELEVALLLDELSSEPHSPEIPIVG
jgi:DNA-binding PucR family transcriptional regulator